jgi:hypothetical protein
VTPATTGNASSNRRASQTIVEGPDGGVIA